jgi:hypothetical protein
MMFKLNKDGSGYSVLHTFEFGGPDGGDGFEPRAGLVKGTDGALYSATYAGGNFNLGMVFKWWPEQTPDIIDVAVTGNSVTVGFAGAGGYQYQVLRSTDLIQWDVSTTITMPSAGIYNYQDPSAIGSMACYRVVWVP